MARPVQREVLEEREGHLLLHLAPLQEGHDHMHHTMLEHRLPRRLVQRDVDKGNPRILPQAVAVVSGGGGGGSGGGGGEGGR